MKIKLYKKFVKLVCKDLGMSRKQLFSRDFNDSILPCYKFNIKTHKIEKDACHLIVLSTKCPLSQIWNACGAYIAWLLKYWRFSHWKPYIQTKIDLGENEKDAVIDVIDIIQGKVK